MFSILMVTFREGLEAFLIIAIAGLYLRSSERRDLVWALCSGLVVAVLGSTVLGIWLAKTSSASSLREGWLAFIAAILVFSCIWHMMRHGQRMSSDIRQNLGSALQKSRVSACLGVFSFVLLFVGREGIEAATMLASMSAQASPTEMMVSGFLGLILAASVALSWIRFGRTIDVGLFFKATAVFLGIFAVQLLVYAFHEFTEAKALPWLDNDWWHDASEPLGPEGRVGAWLSYALLIVPVAFVVIQRCLPKRTAVSSLS